MRKIVILLALLAVVFGQELVIENLSGAYNSGTEYYKYYKYSRWNDVKDFAVYGWFKFGSQYARNEWATIFHMTANENDWTNASKVGDRVLAFFTIGATLHNPTYSIARGNNNYYEDLAYAANDLDKWNFFYVAHSGAESSQFAYYNLAGSGIKSKKIGSITHNTSPYYRINVGRSFSYKYVPGNLWRVTIHGGQGAYRESGFEQITNVAPQSLPTCPTVYSGYAYTGKATNVCESVPTYDVRSIHSVYVPSGYAVTIYDSNNFAGKKITYNQSIEQIDEHNWALLVAEKAITIENDDRVALRRNSNNKKNN